MNELFYDTNQKRRRIPMLVKIVRRVMHILALAVLLIMPINLITPINAWGGESEPYEIPDTDFPGFVLANFWDQRARFTTVQITNTCAFGVNIHVNVFNVPNNCEDFDFNDTLTANDTHVYDLRDLQGNTTVIAPPDFTDGYGIFLVTVVDAAVEGSIVDDFCLIGNFRVIAPGAGYEYRTNSASFEQGFADETAEYIFNFNDVDGADLSDVVGMLLEDANVGDDPADIELFDQEAWVEFDPEIFNAGEVGFSCSLMAFACTPSDGLLAELILADIVGDGGTPPAVIGFDLGINDHFLNSRGEPSICSGSNDVGFVLIEAVDEGNAVDDDDGSFVGFIGLNNGDGTGSMDSWWAERETD